ncbi:hypothetical protein BCR37DRAFT_376891 [Protomyces lactucae-debilis]|uniref:Uncharacterized protein n=1 Tax=Protomyces lactucae-debilis TaxID=2754530 RepID=A0A1Y2FQQ7_PROLT|nr:uncharacterized protein BCR37DRAFT_376891 [Protomyces lactucae-debilis]ORY86323.1 hypothetical protein BCR37DRAFT_376891 [Protomyces lactucae-debilis]
MAISHGPCSSLSSRRRRSSWSNVCGCSPNSQLPSSSYALESGQHQQQALGGAAPGGYGQQQRTPCQKYGQQPQQQPGQYGQPSPGRLCVSSGFVYTSSS